MTVTIYHLKGSNQGKQQVFDCDSISLGRAPDNDVVFHSTEDATVSGHHATISKENDGWVYVDNNSSNGSWVGEKQVSRFSLSGGEEIALGKNGSVVKISLSGTVDSPKAVSVLPSKGVGNKTVAMMIQSAISNSRNQNTGKVPTLSFVRQVAGEAARHGSRTFKVVMFCIVLLLASAIGFLVWQLHLTRLEMTQLANSKVAPSEIGERIASLHGKDIYLLIYRTRTGYEQGFCTAFAVTQTGLLTNAHCVAQMNRLNSEGASFFAAPNAARGARYPIVSWKSHSGYDASANRPTVDIGLVQINGIMPSTVQLADGNSLAKLAAGSQIFVYGFPGDLSDVRSPVATITDGVVGRLTTFAGQQGQQSEMQLLQYSAFTTKGTSGSPVFDKFGRVIAVNSGYYQGKAKVMIKDAVTGKSEEAKVAKDLSGYSFGIRIDLANEVLK